MKTILVFLFFFILVFNQTSGQEYQKIIEPNSTTWYLAHQQLAGYFIDTIFAGNQTDDWIDLWYCGIFVNNEVTYAGKVKSSENNDSVWYIAPETTEEILIYNLNLIKGDTFEYTGSVVDTVFIKNNRKHIEFNEDTGWGEKVQFIESVGPNHSLIYAWDLGIGNPFVVCQFEAEQKTYSTENSQFKDCELLTDNFSQNKFTEIKIFPIPFKNELNIYFQEHKLNHVYILNLSGQIIFQQEYMIARNTINTSGFGRGIYFLKISAGHHYKTYKILKQ